MDTIIGDCPLGAKCEEAKTVNGKQVLVRCPWYTKVMGRNVNTNEDTDEWGCAIAWLPTLMVNASNESRKGVAAIESFRNATLKESELTRQVLATPFNSRMKVINE
jgi:hypothetical protein|tara:strand:+ start:456 stop:773 length:318 start_codon:yes stop_codon:yes gene_type:complete